MKKNIKSCLPVTILMLLQIILAGVSLMAQEAPPVQYPGIFKMNYVRLWEATAPETNPSVLITRPVKDVKQTTQYFDGLGRLLQTVYKQGSLQTNPADPASAAGAVDLVKPVVYDQYWRETHKYLPFASNNADGNTLMSDGSLKLNPFQQQAAFMNAQYGAQGETWFYEKNNVELSPLNRVLETFAPGNSWAGTSGQASEINRRSIKIKMWNNTSIDDVKKWTVTDVANSFGTYTMPGAYAANELLKQVTVDETGRQIIDFRDKGGRSVLKKIQLTATADNGSGSGYTGWICTYYLYDDYNNLRCVIQPKGVELLIANSWNITALSNAILNEQCFRYEYDHRNRMTRKKAPGSGEMNMVYDKWDRLVLAQDSNLRTQNKWVFTKYDQFDRPIMTGLYTNATYTSLSTMQNYLNTQNLARFENYTPAGSAPFYSLNLSFPVITYTDVLKANYYDNYAWTNGVPVDYRTFNSGYNSYFWSPSNTTWPYPQALATSTQTKGLVTGSITKTTDGATPMAQSIFYDDRGRPIQTKTENLLGGCDIMTTQYTFSGHVLKTMMQHVKPSPVSVMSFVFTDYHPDELGRVIRIRKAVSAGIDGAPSVGTGEVVTTLNEYDKLGNVKTKKIGTKKDASGAYTSDPVETQTLEYNIRGWLLGMNRTEMLGTNGQHATRNFAFDLGYDKLTNAAGRNYTAAQFNGNVSGMIWKTNGDGIRRKYDFAYDNSNRLLQGLFEQNDPGGSTWGNTLANFNVKMGDGSSVATAYDANGNIKQMQHWGLKVTGISPIDNLSYNYVANSNKLQNVIDANNDSQTKLGDFRSSSLYMTALGGTKTSGAIDYTYDGNGNLVKDRNKDIGDGSNNGITYNYLNLPSVITVRTTAGAVKGTITYTYDADGNKLKKVVTEGASTKTTHYLSGFIYENNALQFVLHEEGRVRFTPAAGATPSKFHFDYFLKDHVGNVRMVLTEERVQDVYPAATLEGNLATPADAAYIEKNYYQIEAAKVVNATEATGITTYQNNNGNPPYNTNPNGNATANSQKLYKLAASAVTNGGVTGLSFAIKVMGGDKIDVWGKSYYFQNNTGTNNYEVPVSGILNGFVGSPGGIAAGKTTGAELNGVAVITSAIGNFLSDPNRNNGGTTTTPKAYVNYILLDDNFRFVSGGFSRVGAANSIKNHYDDAALQNINVTRNGYLYVYVSNQSPVNVFFDNLQVIHTRGPILEETHYYPYGLTMAGISSKAATWPDNKYKHIGKDLQSREFSDGSGLEQYDFGARFYDQQIGRWHVQDPRVDKWTEFTPYVYTLNNPINLVDLDGEDVYILYYTKGNSSGDEMFKAAAETRKKAIEEGENFDSEKDKVIMIGVEDISDIQSMTEWVVDTYSEQYGKTAEVGVWSHSGTDGPIGTQDAKKDALSSYPKQMTLAGWGKINFNWKDKGTTMGFYGCNTANENANQNFAQNISGLSNYKDVEVRGQSTSSYPSFYTNIRATSIARSYNLPGAWSIGGHTYMIGGNSGEGARALSRMPTGSFPAANKMNVYKNRQKLRSDFQPGKQKK